MSSGKRTNQEWTDALSGLLGSEEQNDALDDLANYLYVVACNHLQKKQDSINKLNALSDADLAALAQEFVQDCMEKMIKEDFALLEKFSGHGRFLGWSAQVIINICNSELRRIPWQRSERLQSSAEQIIDEFYQPEGIALHDLVRTTIATCLDSLPERYRYALVQCVIEGESAADVGEVLDITANAVHLLVFRAKKKMQEALSQEGIGSDLTELMAS